MRLAGIEIAKVHSPAARSSTEERNVARPSEPTRAESAARRKCAASRTGAVQHHYAALAFLAAVLRAYGFKGVAQTVHINTCQRTHVPRLAAHCNGLIAEVSVSRDRWQ